MIKRTLAVAVAIIMLLSVVVNYVSAEQETATNTGFSNIVFTNGYRGFCLDRSKKGANDGDPFSAGGGTSGSVNVNNGADVSQQLKILFTHCFDGIFVSDGNGGYTIGDTNTLQAVIWHYTNDQYVWGAQLTLVNAVDGYFAQYAEQGITIPDEGYSIERDGKVITFSFLVMNTDREDQQDFFAYKLTVNDKVDTSGDDTSGDDTSGDDTSSDETSGDDTSSDDTSGDDTSGDDTSGDDTSDNTSDEPNIEESNPPDASDRENVESSDDSNFPSIDGGESFDESTPTVDAGDDFDAWLWFALLFVSLCGCVFALRCRRATADF